MAILAIYIVLDVLYESFIHPITILSGLPPAVFGTLPIALGCGEGADARQPLGLATVGRASACPLPLAGEFFTASQGAVFASICSTPHLTSWVRARYFASSGSPVGRGSQVVRQRSAKPLLVGSIPTRASNFLFVIRRESRLADIPARCGYLS